MNGARASCSNNESIVAKKSERPAATLIRNRPSMFTLLSHHSALSDAMSIVKRYFTSLRSIRS